MKTNNHARPLSQAENWKNSSLSKTSPYPILFVKGRKGQNGGLHNSSIERRLLGVFWEKDRKAFTLIELIIVITILAILATIAFMSFQGYMKQSRDAVRVSDLTSASKGLTIFFTKSWMYPETESGVLISKSGNPIGYQWHLWENAVRSIKMNTVPIDPVDLTKYTYSTNETKTKYQLMAYTESSNLISFVSQSYAIDYSVRWVKMVWDELGVILNTDNSFPTESIETATGSKTYKLVFENATIEWSGNIFPIIEWQRDKGMIGHWNMDTITNAGKIKDFSAYGKDGICYYSVGNSIACWNTPWPQFVTGTQGLIMSWAGLKIDNFSTINLSSFSLSINIKTENTWTGYLDLINQWDCITFPWCEFPWEFPWWLWIHQKTLRFISWWNDWDETIDTDSIIWWDNLWHNIILVKNTKSIKIYVDGIKVWEKNNVVETIHTNLPLYISRSGHTNWAEFNAWLIDEVRIYNRVLSESEIQALYQLVQ